jgi:hypothetical protein
MNRKEVDGGGSDVPDELTLHLAYAEASVLLIESLMRVLVERHVVPISTLIEEVETAIDTKRAMVHENHHARIAGIAAGVLAQIANSLAAGTQREER